MCYEQLHTVITCRAYHSKGNHVNVWIVNSEWLYSLYWCLGADSVTTNFVHLLYGVAFAELGVLSDGPEDPAASQFSTILSLFDTDKWRWDVGIGGRYKTVIGPLRLDLTFRPIYPEDAGPSRSPAERERGQFYCNNAPYNEWKWRSFDILSSTVDRSQPLDRRFPVAVNIFIGITEAI